MTEEIRNKWAKNKSPEIFYKFKTLSVKHLKELQEDINKLDREGKLSNNEIYREYLSTKKFEIPENFPDAQSLIIMAVFTRLLLVNFHTKNMKYEVMLPPQYYDAGISNENLCNIILQEIIQGSGYRVERAKQTCLKLLAVRSGLGRYGRNNICYVEQMGSLVTLNAYFTDYTFQDDNWNEVRMMDMCKDCRICIKQCPCDCITDENYVIDAGKCLTLYNEISGEFPEWINPDAHNALFGCMKCQLHCPANSEVVKLTGRLEDITEEETQKILKGTPDKKLLHSLSKKLKMPSPAALKELFPILTRNLGVLLR